MLKSKLTFVALCLALSVFGQSSLDRVKYEDTKKLVENASVNVYWGGDNAYYFWEESGDKLFQKVNLKSGKKQLLFKFSGLKGTLANQFQASEEELAKWNIYSYEVDEKNHCFLFRWKGEQFRYSLRNGTLLKVKEEERQKNNNFLSNRVEYWKKFNQDSSQYIFGKGHQLYLFNVKEGKEYRLSDDGEPYFSYTNNNIADNDTSKYVSTSAVWVGDRIVAWREDKRKIGEMAILNSLSNPRPTWRTYKFPTPGDSAIQYDINVWDAKTRLVKNIDLTPEKDQRLILPGQLINGRTQLFADRLGVNSSYVFFLRRSRSNERVELCRLDFDEGKVSVIIDESIWPHLNEQLFAVHIFNADQDILFWSERTGYGQYFHFNNQGKLLNKVGPKGDYVVSKIVELDTLNRSLFLEVYGFNQSFNPYYKQYLKCYLDNENAYLLTPEDADHHITLSKNKEYILNTYSTADQPNSYVLRDVKGRLISKLGTANIEKLRASGWYPAERVTLFAADDSTKLYGLLYKPSDFDLNKKYPIISSVYPGPQDDFVPQSFSIDDNYHQSLADLGFLVLQIPSRGSSPYRGLKFHSYSHGNMRDYALADNKKAIEDLAAERTYIDLSKVGMFGHSGGGYMTATALLTYPEFYKVGVAASGNYDPNIYTQWWGETYHGVNTSGKANYIPTTIELAPNLKGKLLLITGDVDTNVHPAHTLRLADALIKSEKFFDMMILPGKDHGLGDWYYQSLIRNYFLNHLK